MVGLLNHQMMLIESQKHEQKIKVLQAERKEASITTAVAPGKNLKAVHLHQM